MLYFFTSKFFMLCYLFSTKISYNKIKYLDIILKIQERILERKKRVKSS